MTALVDTAFVVISLLVAAIAAMGVGAFLKWLFSFFVD